MILADWAAVAIDNARLYETSESRRHELERAVRGLQATRDTVEAIGGDIELENVLALIAKRGRALVQARSLVIMLREGERLVVQASAGRVSDRRGARLRIADSTWGRVLEHREPERIMDVGSRLAMAAGELGVCEASTALLVPMLYRGTPVGVLGAFDKGESAARLHRGGRADAACLRDERRDSRRTRPERAGGPPAQRAGRRGRRAQALGARAARRDAAGAGRPARAALGGTQTRRSGQRAGGDARGRRHGSSRTSRTSARSSPTCARRPWTSSACRRRSRRCWTATASRAGCACRHSSTRPPSAEGAGAWAPSWRWPSTGWCRRR